MLKRFVNYLVIVLCMAITAVAQKPPIRVSAWYWLNSAPKTDWEGDFVTMKHLGFTDVLLGWGLDTAGVVTRKEDTKQAIRWAHKAGMGAYLIVWQPSANSLKRSPEFVQIDATGKALNTFDVFNPAWRSTQWKNYLQDIASTYKDEPGMAGYAFDDSFGGGNVSYGPYEQKAFGGDLPRKPGDFRWDDWVRARQNWWDDWAKDTVKYIRDIDPDKKHEIYIEDSINSILSPTRHANNGVDLGEVAKHFDAVGGYTVPQWTSDPASDAKVAQVTKNAITSVRKMVGPKKQIIYTFWSANGIEERKPGPAMYPTAAQIQAVCEEALKLGVRHIDMYGYRIGEYRVSRADMARMMPAEPAPYVLTGQFPQKFMWDRPEIHTELGKYLRSLTQQ